MRVRTVLNGIPFGRAIINSGVRGGIWSPPRGWAVPRGCDSKMSGDLQGLANARQKAPSGGGGDRTGRVAYIVTERRLDMKRLDAL